MKKIIALLSTFLYAGLSLAQTSVPSAQAIAAKIQADEAQLADWPQLSRYRAENATVPAPKPDEARVVFMGDSITDRWGRHQGSFFPGKPYINRGISGQITGQMLVRFRPDVLALKPRVVVILAGINDIGGNADPATLGVIEDNLTSMAELARDSNVNVVLASIMPVNGYVEPNMASSHPAENILAVNAWIKSYAQREHFVYLDYYSAMLDAHRQLKRELSDDGLHPNAAGYAVMAPLAEQAIDKALVH
jgi:lysophospholipase L1-like esterase